jgi:hypothetical protein
MQTATVTQAPRPAQRPSPEPGVARGRVLSAEDGRLVLGLPGTDYQLHLVTDGKAQPDAVGYIRGRIVAQAMRVDVVDKGGSFVEPVYGRPRRLQGMVLATDPRDNTLTVQGPFPFVCVLNAHQHVVDFHPGQFVSFDVQRGTRFEPAGGEST